MTPQPPRPHPRTLLSHCSVVFISQMCPKLNTEPVVESSFSWALLQRASTLRKALLPEEVLYLTCLVNDQEQGPFHRGKG